MLPHIPSFSSLDALGNSAVPTTLNSSFDVSHITILDMDAPVPLSPHSFYGARENHPAQTPQPNLHQHRQQSNGISSLSAGSSASSSATSSTAFQSPAAPRPHSISASTPAISLTLSPSPSFTKLSSMINSNSSNNLSSLVSVDVAGPLPRPASSTSSSRATSVTSPLPVATKLVDLEEDEDFTPRQRSSSILNSSNSFHSILPPPPISSSKPFQSLTHSSSFLLRHSSSHHRDLNLLEMGIFNPNVNIELLNAFQKSSQLNINDNDVNTVKTELRDDDEEEIFSIVQFSEEDDEEEEAQTLTRKNRKQNIAKTKESGRRKGKSKGKEKGRESENDDNTRRRKKQKTSIEQLEDDKSASDDDNDDAEEEEEQESDQEKSVRKRRKPPKNEGMEEDESSSINSSTSAPKRGGRRRKSETKADTPDGSKSEDSSSSPLPGDSVPKKRRRRIVKVPSVETMQAKRELNLKLHREADKRRRDKAGEALTIIRSLLGVPACDISSANSGPRRADVMEKAVVGIKVLKDEIDELEKKIDKLESVTNSSEGQQLLTFLDPTRISPTPEQNKGKENGIHSHPNALTATSDLIEIHGNEDFSTLKMKIAKHLLPTNGSNSSIVTTTSDNPHQRIETLQSALRVLLRHWESERRQAEVLGLRAHSLFSTSMPFFLLTTSGTILDSSHWSPFCNLTSGRVPISVRGRMASSFWIYLHALLQKFIPDFPSIFNRKALTTSQQVQKLFLSPATSKELMNQSITHAFTGGADSSLPVTRHSYSSLSPLSHIHLAAVNSLIQSFAERYSDEELESLCISSMQDAFEAFIKNEERIHEEREKHKAREAAKITQRQLMHHQHQHHEEKSVDSPSEGDHIHVSTADSDTSPLSIPSAALLPFSDFSSSTLQAFLGRKELRPCRSFFQTLSELLTGKRKHITVRLFGLKKNGDATVLDMEMFNVHNEEGMPVAMMAFPSNANDRMDDAPKEWRGR